MVPKVVVQSESEIDSDEDLVESSKENDVESDEGPNVAQKGSSKWKGSKGKKYKDEEMKQLLSMCFKYYAIIEGNKSNAEGGLTKHKKDQTWQMITDQLNRLE